MPPPMLKLRRGQAAFMRLQEQYRVCGLVARRQYGKTTLFSAIALKKMMKRRDHTVVFGSAKIGLSRDVVLAESRIIRAAISGLVAENKQLTGALHVHDSINQKEPDHLTEDDFAELFEAQRLEFRLYHDRTSYSRTKIVALHPDTVGETGDLMCDELRAIKGWQDVYEAVSPIISSNPDFRFIMATTIPRDDSHYAFGQLLPPVEFNEPPNPEGVVYESQGGIMCQRLDAWDAFEDGIPIYDDKTGEPLHPDESRARSKDKDAWDRNYGCKFKTGGIASCGLAQMHTAQTRGAQDRCMFVEIDDDTDFDKALLWLDKNLTAAPVGIGVDPATTVKAKSNPTGVTVTEEHGNLYAARLILAWKTDNPAVADERIDRILATIKQRMSGGGPAKAMCIDATNERYWASATRDRLAGELPVTLVVGSEKYADAHGEPMNMKQYTCSMLIGELNDNHLTIPPERYVLEDWRLVRTERGIYAWDPDAQGRHGDTFDSTRLSIFSFEIGGPVEVMDLSGIGIPPTTDWQPWALPI
jgi:hypothetical protein